MTLGALLDEVLGPACPATAARERFEELDELLVRWGHVVDLVGFKTAAERHRRYFMEALKALPWLPEGGSALDLGSGGGSPALPLALAGAEISWTLVEASARKAVFLEEAIRALGLENARVVQARYETWSPKAPVDVITVRGVRLSEAIRERLRADLRPGGRLLWFTSEARVSDAWRWAGWVRREGPVQLVPGGGYLGVFAPADA